MKSLEQYYDLYTADDYQLVKAFLRRKRAENATAFRAPRRQAGLMSKNVAESSTVAARRHAIIDLAAARPDSWAESIITPYFFISFITFQAKMPRPSRLHRPRRARREATQFSALVFGARKRFHAAPRAMACARPMASVPNIFTMMPPLFEAMSDAQVAAGVKMRRRLVR